MDNYMIREKDKKEAEYLTKKIRKLMKERKLMEAGHNLNKLSDILMNIRKIE